MLAECRRLLEVTFSDFDVLLVPSAPGEAPQGLATTGDAVFNQMWTALHTPAVTVPVFKGPAGFRLQSISSGFEGFVTCLGAYRTEDAAQPTIMAAVVRYGNALLKAGGETQIIMTVPQD